MINRIDVFMPPISQYGVLPYLTREIFEALERQGVGCRILVAEKENPEPFLESIFSDPPECTLSINGLLPDDQGNFFCDMIKIPHIACIIGNFTQYSILAQSPLNIITCPDAFGCHYFRGLNCENSLFMPLGVGKTLAPDPALKRIHDVVFIGTCIDYENIRDLWKNKYSESICRVLEQAQEMTLSDYSTSYIEALVQALNETAQSEGIDPTTFNMLEVLGELELFVKGRDRVELIRSIKGAKVEIFGAGEEGSNWEKYFDSQSNVTLHPPIPFEEAIEVMKQSKIVLNSSPSSKNGGHERIFTAMGCESLLVTSQNVFMDEHFVNGMDLAFYNHGEWNDVDEIINHYLTHNEEREEVASRGREKVMQEHTWDHRVKTVLEQLPPFLVKARSHIQ